MALSIQKHSISDPLAISWKYDVFLSFRGETRKGFTDHLYKALQGQGIKVFRDIEVERGKTISSSLLTAIEESRFAIIVLSPKYASSTWCLDELSKITECMEVRGTILPVFYKVKPSHVRKQRGAIAKAFNKHEKNFIKDVTKVKRWRTVLTTVGGIAGWISKDRFETDLIKDIVESVSEKLACMCCLCVVCNNKNDDGSYVNCKHVVGPRECFRCRACNLPFTAYEFLECKDQAYPKHCDTLRYDTCNNFIPDDFDGHIEYMEDPFWLQKYCPS